MAERTESGFVAGISREFTTQTWVLIPVGVALSVVAAYVVNVVKVPFLYMDALGVVLVALLAGPWAAALTGVFVNVVEGFLVNPTFWAYTPLQVAFGLAAGYMARRGWFRRYWKVVVVGLVIAAISIVMGAPITVLAFGGVTGTGSDAVTTFFRATGANIWSAVVGQTLVVEPIDKVLTALLAALIAKRVPRRYMPETAASVLDRES
ncbi:ECF transporter S component [Salinigranum salinum]|uniref:ECF transporter S component n=1 Tax=Salinigranum salinum TaxID=1364937 RepID=UPI0012612239|nr:ECF transporter S component [Salinigranum salinum]